MKRTLKLALTAAIGLAVFVPAMAENFPDVPENHWVYEALDNMKREGVLVGYPLDGMYRGTRNATRYELASAVNAAYQKLKGMQDGLAEQVRQLKELVGAGDAKALTDRLTELEKQIAGIKQPADMTRLVEEFRKELASQGADVDQMKKDLANLEGRVKVLENRKLPVSISGDLNFLVLAGASRDDQFGMNKDGFIYGIDNTTNMNPVGMTKDLNVYHEAAVTLKGTNEEGPMWHATIVHGNMVGMMNAGVGGVMQPSAGFGNQTQRPFGADYRQSNSDTYIQDASVKFDTSLIGVGFTAEVGRITKSVSPMLFQRQDVTTYFANPRWDDNQHRLDGGSLTFNFGNVDLDVFAGRNTGLTGSQGAEIFPLTVTPMGMNNPLVVDTTLGGSLGFKIGKGNFRAGYLYHDTDAVVASNVPNRLNVYGIDGDIDLSGFRLSGGWAESEFTHNTSGLGGDVNNTAWHAGLSYNADRWGIGGEYREIEANFFSFGNWRRIGTFHNPTDINTWQVGAWYDLTNDLRASYSGEFGEIDSSGTDISSHIGQLNYRINDSWTALLGYEEVRVELGATDTLQRWGTFGLGYALGPNATWNIAYEHGSVRNVGPWGSGQSGTYGGGFVNSQLTVRF